MLIFAVDQSLRKLSNELVPLIFLSLLSLHFGFFLNLLSFSFCRVNLGVEKCYLNGLFVYSKLSFVL